MVKDEDLNDLSALATNLGAWPAAAFAEFRALVPEPASAALLGLSAATFAARRWCCDMR